MTDAELMGAVRDGDTAQLGVLFERHHRRLHGYLVRLAGGVAIADDLVQEVFVRMLRYRHTYRPEGEFTGWMFALARNAAFDHFGRGRREHLTAEGELPERADPAPLADQRLGEEDDGEILRRALARLPPEKRDLLIMARFRYLPYEVIAGQLGISVGAVKVRVHRAIRDLRECFRLEGGTA